MSKALLALCRATKPFTRADLYKQGTNSTWQASRLHKDRPTITDDWHHVVVPDDMTGQQWSGDGAVGMGSWYDDLDLFEAG